MTIPSTKQACPIHDDTHYCKYKIGGAKCECKCTCCHNPSQGEKEDLDYERNYSHFHCWDQDGEPACGRPLETHKQCCLCDMLYIKEHPLGYFGKADRPTDGSVDNPSPQKAAKVGKESHLIENHKLGGEHIETGHKSISWEIGDPTAYTKRDLASHGENLTAETTAPHNIVKIIEEASRSRPWEPHLESWQKEFWKLPIHQEKDEDGWLGPQCVAINDVIPFIRSLIEKERVEWEEKAYIKGMNDRENNEKFLQRGVRQERGRIAKDLEIISKMPGVHLALVDYIASLTNNEK